MLLIARGLRKDGEGEGASKGGLYYSKSEMKTFIDDHLRFSRKRWYVHNVIAELSKLWPR